MSAVLYAESVAGRNGAIARALGLHPLPASARPVYEDALAALAVAESLAGLGPRWDVLHDLPLPDGRFLDHLIVGPAGVFALRAMHVPGPQLVIDGDQLAWGRRTENLGQLRADAGAVAERLALGGAPVEVRPAVVVVGEAKCVVRLPAHGIQVVALSQLERWLGSRRRVLAGEDVAELSNAVDRPDNWPETPIEPDLAERFEALRGRVRAALRRRSIVAAFAFAVAFGLVWASIAVLAATTFRT
jgi:hypothetical protein